MGKVTLFIDITVSMINQNDFYIKSNVKPELIDDLICDYIRMQLDEKADLSSPNDADVYHLRLEVDLERDSFKLISDTGNKSLSCGILKYIVGTKESALHLRKAVV